MPPLNIGISVKAKYISNIANHGSCVFERIVFLRTLLFLFTDSFLHRQESIKLVKLQNILKISHFQITTIYLHPIYWAMDRIKMGILENITFSHPQIALLVFVHDY